MIKLAKIESHAFLVFFVLQKYKDRHEMTFVSYPESSMPTVNPERQRTCKNTTLKDLGQNQISGLLA